MKGPRGEDICYATTNRQQAVKAVAEGADLVLVVGAQNSSNSKRLVEVASRAGARDAMLVADADALDFTRIEKAVVIGLSAGASAPEVLVEGVIAAINARYETRLEEVETVREDITFNLPAALRDSIMAVYTRVDEDQLAEFLTEYDVGIAQSFTGITHGVENSNYRLTTTAGDFILTLYEKRVDPADLPFFIGLMGHMAAAGIPCPEPVAGRDSEVLRQLNGRPAAMVTFLTGTWNANPSVSRCRAVGGMLARMHLAGADFTMQRNNALAATGWRPLLDAADASAAETLLPGCGRAHPTGLILSLQHGPMICPEAFCMPIFPR